jgi:hypothetical protein
VAAGCRTARRVFRLPSGAAIGVRATETSLSPQSIKDYFDDDSFHTEVELFDPKIKVGLYWEGSGLRITVSSIRNYKLPDQDQRLGVQLIIKGGTEGQFVGGKDAKTNSYNDFFVPVSSSGVGAENTCPCRKPNPAGT